VTTRRDDGGAAAIVATAETPYSRHPPAETTTAALLADAFVRVLEVAGVGREEVDGLGVASFTLAPDHAIDLAWRLGVRLHWAMEDPHGGVSALNLLQHALHAVESGEAANVVLLAGDHFRPGDFERLVSHYNRATSEHLAPIPTGGPNAQFAARHARALRLSFNHDNQLGDGSRNGARLARGRILGRGGFRP